MVLTQKQKLSEIKNKRYYGTGNKNKMRHGRSSKRFDARRNMHYKDIDAFGPKRPKMSILDQIFFILGQCFMNILWLSSDLVRCFFRLVIGFPLFVGYYALLFFVVKPLKFFLLGLFNIVIRFITWKLAFIVFCFFYLNLKLKSLRNGNTNSIAQHLEIKEKISPSNFIFSNRANAYLFKKTDAINKKFPQLHEIEGAFFNLHSPQNSLGARMFNFFHPFDFRTWFWRTSWEDTQFIYYMPNAWSIKQGFLSQG